MSAGKTSVRTLPDQLVGRDPEGAAGLRVHHQVSAGEVLDGDDRGRLVDDRVDPALAGAEGLFDRRPVGDVVADADQGCDLPVDADDRTALREQDPLLAVRPHDPLVEHERLAGLDAALDRRPDAIALLGTDPGDEILGGAAELTGLEAVDPMQLVRPGDPLGGQGPLPDSEADDPLGLGHLIAVLAQLLLDPLLLGHIAEQDHEAVVAGEEPGLEPALERLVVIDQPSRPAGPQRPLVGDPEVDPGLLRELAPHGLAEQIVDGSAEHPRRRLVQVLKAPLAVDDDDPVGEQLDQRGDLGSRQRAPVGALGIVAVAAELGLRLLGPSFHRLLSSACGRPRSRARSRRGRADSSSIGRVPLTSR